MKHYSFDDWEQEDVLAFLTDNGYTHIKQLQDGDWCGIQRLMFTHSVCMGVTPTNPFAYRWCFEDKIEALQFIVDCKEVDDVPTSRASLKGHRYKTEPLLMEYDERGFAKW